MPDLLDNLGLAYQGAGDLDAATDIWLEQLAIAEADGDMGRQAALRVQLAVLLGQIPKAMELAEFDTRNSATFVLPSAIYSLRMARTALLYFTGDLHGALTALDQDLADVAAIGLNRMHARMLAHKAHLLAEMGQTEDASRCVEQAQQWRKVHENALEHGLQTATAAMRWPVGIPSGRPT